MKKSLLFIVFSILFTGLFLSCTSVNIQQSEQDIYVVFTNDIHSYVGNTKTDENKNQVPALRPSKIAKMVNDMRNEGKSVLLVDAGDEIQGCIYGSFDSGKSVIDIMNAAGYQLATPGNHEFDYGTENFFNIKKRAKFPYISCNFYPTAESTKKNSFDGVKIFNVNGKKIAFVGISTPSTITSSTPVYFQNEKKEFVYTIAGISNPEDMYAAVQKAIDSVKDKADYIIALGHVGVGIDEVRNKISSEDVIKNTTGLNAFIDGHSHSIIEDKNVADKSGNKVVLTQTGQYLDRVGLMKIEKGGQISTKFITDYEGQDNTVAKLEEDLITKINDVMGKKIAVLETELYINNPENQKQRLVRSREMNSGDFVADSMYWYFNEIKQLNCDIVLQNGGAVRSSIKAGEITGKDVKSIAPFGNQLCVISATGQQILDALEMGVTVIGEWDKDWDCPAENGGFLQVAGLKYKIDSSVKTSVVFDENKMFKAVTGAYRVQDVQVYNKDSGSYEPLELKKLYKVGGQNYILKNGGNGLSMFQKCSTVVDFLGQDSDILSMYIQNFTKTDELPVLKTSASPLINYKGYLIDYENPFGSGRIIQK